MDRITQGRKASERPQSSSASRVTAGAFGSAWNLLEPRNHGDVHAIRLGDLRQRFAGEESSAFRVVQLRRARLGREEPPHVLREALFQHGKHTQSAPAWGYAFGAVPTSFSIMSAWSGEPDA